MDVDKFRQFHLAVAEMIDAWRLVPRVLLLGYAYLVYKVVDWYMTLEPYILANCSSPDITKCIVEAPSTQHAALVTAVVGISAAVFGLYTSTGKRWNGFTKWNEDKQPEKQTKDTQEPSSGE